MKKYLVLLLSLLFVTACSKKKYDTVDTQEEAIQINKEASSLENVLVPYKMYFTFDSSSLSKESKASLDLVSDWLNSKKDVNIVLEGHCDERGTREYNMALGQRRAESAKKYLVSKGIDSNRIKTRSYGKERPEFVGTGESVWSKNRRVEVVEIK